MRLNGSSSFLDIDLYNVKTVYHGSNMEVNFPRIIITRKRKDFGNGFYVTKTEEQAVKCARRNLSFNMEAVVSSYSMCIDPKLNVKVFKEIDDEWVDFIARCRSGFSHSYDIVEGPMADDKIYNFAQMYLRGQIPKEIFISYCKFRYPTHQICFCTDKSLDCLKFIESYEVS